MRSLLKVLFLTLTLITSMFTVSHASLYPEYLGGDTNFVLVDGHMGRAWYIDRSSLNVQKYAPPQYIISVNTAVVENADKGNITISDIKNLRFFYNSDLGKMYYDSTGMIVGYILSQILRGQIMVVFVQLQKWHLQ